MGTLSSRAENILPLKTIIFGHIRGKQESCEKHISDCKTEVECEACNMKTLWSSGNLFIKYPSVAHSLPSNKQWAFIYYVWCIIRPSHYNAYMHMYCPKERLSCKQIHRCVCEYMAVCRPTQFTLLSETWLWNVSVWTKNGAGTMFCGKNATRRVNCLSDMSCVWFNA